MSDARTLPRRPARRGAVAVPVGVLGLHVLVLAVVLQLGVWPDRGPVPAAARPLVVWLLNGAVAPPPPAVRRPVLPIAAVPRSTPAPRLPLPGVAPAAPAAPPAPTVPGALQAITLPGAAAEALQATPRDRPDPDPLADLANGPKTTAPLNLALPRAAPAASRQRNPALDDVRANTWAPVNMAALIDKALGGDPDGAISEERLADGSVRFRRGMQCVISRPNQAQNIDPFNGSVLPKPRLLDRC